MIRMTTMSRFMRLSTIAAAACLVTAARGAERTPYPAFTGNRVYVAGVSDRFDGLTDQIKRLEKTSPQTYYVAVVKSFGDGQHAAQHYADELFRIWRSEASRRGLKLDPDRSVIVAVALADRKIGVHAGLTLREKLGVDSATLSRELIPANFNPLAKQEKYPEAISALLNGINDWIAAKDRATSRTTAEAPMPAPAPNPPPSSTKTTLRPSVVAPGRWRRFNPSPRPPGRTWRSVWGWRQPQSFCFCSVRSGGSNAANGRTSGASSRNSGPGRSTSWTGLTASRKGSSFCRWRTPISVSR